MELPPTDEHSDENDIIQNRQKQQNVGTCRLAGDAGGRDEGCPCEEYVSVRNGYAAQAKEFQGQGWNWSMH